MHIYITYRYVKVNKMNKYFPDLVKIGVSSLKNCLLQECASEWDECPGIVLGDIGLWNWDGVDQQQWRSAHRLTISHKQIHPILGVYIYICMCVTIYRGFASHHEGEDIKTVIERSI